MKILILGGAGFIGSNFVNYLGSFGNQYSCMVVDKLTYAGRFENIKKTLDERSWDFEPDDICDVASMTLIVRSFKPDVVVNFAAESHVSRSISSPEVFVKTNVLGVQAVMESVRKYAPSAHVIHISTDEVFGQLSEWDAPWTDHDKLNPRSPYAASKASGELIARSYFTTYGIDITVVRPSNCFGPYQFPEKLVPRAVTNLLLGKKVPLMGEGLQMRDWLYVEDLCRYLVEIIRTKPSGECFNIPGNAIHRNRDIVGKILEFMRKDWSDIEVIPHRLAHDFKYHVAGEGIARFEFQPEKAFGRNLRNTIDWYTRNENWWKPLKEEAENGNIGADTGTKTNV